MNFFSFVKKINFFKIELNNKLLFNLNKENVSNSEKNISEHYL